VPKINGHKKSPWANKLMGFFYLPRGMPLGSSKLFFGRSHYLNKPTLMIAVIGRTFYNIAAAA
jgi:hypothetical protein